MPLSRVNISWALDFFKKKSFGEQSCSEMMHLHALSGQDRSDAYYFAL